MGPRGWVVCTGGGGDHVFCIGGKVMTSLVHGGRVHASWASVWESRGREDEGVEMARVGEGALFCKYRGGQGSCPEGMGGSNSDCEHEKPFHLTKSTNEIQ